jgi:hypothetical protein
MISKDDYIEEVRAMIFYSQLGDYVKTDLDDELDMDDYDDFEDYQEARSKGNIIRIDQVFMVWLNGTVFAWNFIHENEELTQDDIIPDWEKIVDHSRCIGDENGIKFYSEFCRLHIF